MVVALRIDSISAMVYGLTLTHEVHRMTKNSGVNTTHTPGCSVAKLALRGVSASSFDPHTIRQLLPAEADPDYNWTLVELIQAEIESQVEFGLPINWNAYRDEFPQLFASTITEAMLHDYYNRLIEEKKSKAFEDTAVIGQFVEREPCRTDIVTTDAMHLCRSDEYEVEFLSFEEADSTTPEMPSLAHIEHKSVCRPFPQAGDNFLGFTLLRELGRGRAGCVFLARQPGLANREVALKITGQPSREAQKLAKLQHTNIVPIHSVHDCAPLQALCMPYLGQATLGDVISEWNRSDATPSAGKAHKSTQANCRTTTFARPKSSEQPLPIMPIEEAAWVNLDEHSTHQSREQQSVAILMRLAKGLSHAHQRGILHLDLKPGNVLITDEGEPLLLDFNLAFDRPTQDREHSGGTLAYMAPEHLEEFGGSSGHTVDERCDLFSLGVVFYEMLTGQLPYTMSSSKHKVGPTLLAQTRRKLAPTVRTHDSSISHGIEAIVKKLLMPQPDDRYQTAGELVEDLQRWTEHRPLLHAVNHSVREQATNWRRRNPYAALYILIGTLAFGTVAATSITLGEISESRRLVAEDASNNLDHRMVTLRADLTDTNNQYRQKAIKTATGLMRLYDVSPETNWQAGKLLASLDEKRLQSTVQNLGELALLMSHAEWLNSQEPTTRNAAVVLDRAESWNRVAKLCYGRQVPEIVANQRAWLRTFRQALPVGELDTGIPESTEGLSVAECFLYGKRALNMNRYDVALTWFGHVAEQDPSHFAGQLAFGWSKYKSGMKEAAVERITIAQSLQPEHPVANYYLAQLFVESKDYANAERTLNKLLEGGQGEANLFHVRTLARIGQGNDTAHIAMKDLKRLEAIDGRSIQTETLRLKIYSILGDKANADTTRERILAIEPKTAFEFYILAIYQIQQDNTDAATTAIDKAVTLDSHEYHYWMMKAALLARRNDYQAAITAQTHAADQQPGVSQVWSYLAFLKAKNGDATAGVSMNKAIELDPSSEVFYSAARVYALLSKTDPTAAGHAIKYLNLAFKNGFDRIDLLKSDEALKSLQDEPSFKKLSDALEVIYRPVLSKTN